ncbi:magnesium and cobalt transport protein CorA [Erwinia sp. OLTSP20]|uniref:magnesium/cobalt transporter CorA n=1 Tax=unclassified Erwinia TaxID=2622719 RepID=UPI000C197C39|nr:MULTISPECIES: magnesium/cobalt transporter CorA [unclassified Erwinia]PIJ50332.1 magnesium and cobalt transport protein CorA [Erwinia sp. OAMSP11]PIJ72169.1 magnesium and cobalt transport protein CorA [Erwinia sp. OLSSP12]PIJ81460.1 magnesium and cobalt transport protein CorA [Erwinia sp. OLCASP19]PIJ84166.1 magnesium and cobalt transport protein CorA [Erwinia sp. OLMTSP26]PIJ85865.1 magnesium and cobalt transport protein CorA [Erwinia sp. OLMDSP33]
MIVNSIAYRQGHEPQRVEVEKISEVIKQPDTFIWLGLLEPDPDFMSTIKQEFNLHELAIEDALTAHQRPKIERYKNSLFIVLKTAHLNENGEVCYGETHLFVGKNFIISVRHGQSDSYASVRQRALENHDKFALGAGYALYCIMDFIVDNYSNIIASLNERIAETEKAMFDSEFNRQHLQSAYNMRRELSLLRNAAQPVEEICSQLIHLHEEIIPDPLRAYIRDVQDHASHVVIDAEEMREVLISAMQVKLALISVQQNEVVKKLAGWGAILVVPTVVFSMYGMNFKNMPELNESYGYPASLVITLAICAWIWKKFRHAGWL